MRCYLDHNATSPLRPEALEAMLPFLRDGAANPSSTHRDGQRARLAVEEAREEVASLVGCAASDVVFTSGGTEAGNAAIFGALEIAAGAAGAVGTGPPVGANVVSTTIEHPAVHRPLRAIEARGIPVIRVGPRPSGSVQAEEVLAAVDERTLLVSVMHVNNETGSVQPLEAIAAACASRGILFHTDAVQALGRIRIPDSAPLVGVSAHKIGGPQGVGALIVRQGVRIEAILRGGPQERRRRAGTENVAGIVGFGAAARLSALRGREQVGTWTSMRERFEAGLRIAFPDVLVHGAAGPRVANTSCFSLPGSRGIELQVALDLAGFSVSTGTACASGRTAPSYVLRALGLPEEVASSALRVSFGWSNAPEDVDRLLEALRLAPARTAVAELREEKP